MKYESKDGTVYVTAESTDQWTGKTWGRTVVDVDGVECLVCDRVVTYQERENVTLRIQLNGKPDLQAAVAEMLAQQESARKGRDAADEAEYKALRDGSTLITATYVDGEYLSDYQVVGKAAELLAEIGAARYVSGWGYAVDRKMIDALGKEFYLAQAAELLKPKIEAKSQAAAARHTHDENINAKRQQLIDSGTRLATPKQLAVIDRARDDWFDLFDGCGSYGVHGPSDDELRLMTIEDASRLIGQIIEARKYDA